MPLFHAVMVQAIPNPLPFGRCRVYRLRRPLKGGTLYPHVTFMSGRGRTIHQSFVDVIKLVFVKFLIIFLRLVPLARFQDTSFALFFIWY